MPRPTDKEIRELAVQAQAKLREAMEEPDVTRAAELEAESDRLHAQYTAQKERAEKYDRMAKIAEDAREITALRAEGADPDNPDADLTPAQKRERTRLCKRSINHGLDALTDSERSVLFGSESLADRIFVRGLRRPNGVRITEFLSTQEREALVAEEKRVFGTSTSADSNAGYTVPEGFLAQIVADMAVWGPMSRPGYTRFLQTAMGNPLPMPTEYGAAIEEASYMGSVGASDHRGEAQTIPNKDLTFGEVIMTAGKYGIARRVNYELTQDTGVDILGYLSNATAMSFGRGLNRAFTKGSNGVSVTTVANRTIVAGIETAILAVASRRDGDSTFAADANRVLTAGGSSASFGLPVATQGGAGSADVMFDLIAQLDPAYRAGARFMMNDAFIFDLRKVKDYDGRYLWQPSLVAGNPDTFSGIPIDYNQHMDVKGAAGRILVTYFDPMSYFVRWAGGMRMKRGDEVLMETDQILFTTVQRVDGAPVRPRGIAFLEGS